MTNLGALKNPRDYDGALGDVMVLSTVTASSIGQLGYKPYPMAYIATADYSTDAATGYSIPITELSFDYVSNATYYLDGILLCQASVATTGLQFALDCSTSITLAALVGVTQLTKAGAGTVFHCYGDGTYVGTMSGVHTAGTTCPAMFSGILKTTDKSGTCTLRMKPETGKDICTVKEHSVLTTLKVV